MISINKIRLKKVILLFLIFIFFIIISFYIFFTYIYPIKEKLNDSIQQIVSAHEISYIELKEIPIELQQSIISTEDRRFYYHFGIDPIGITRAMRTNFRAHEIKEGASTITQQLITNSLLTKEKSINRKIKEIFLSIAIDAYFTKDEILEKYINVIYYGNNSYGIKNASYFYFGKEVKDLNLSEITLLVGIPNSPNKYNPYKDFELSKKRQREVVYNMVEVNILSKEEAENILKSELQFYK